MSLGPDLLSLKASVIWLAVLFAVLVFHCGHLTHVHWQNRWYHCAHIVMLLGMLYMYAFVAFGWHWFPADVWMLIYAVTSAAIIGWMMARFKQRRPLSYLWVLALAQQGAMIYMWMPMADWMAWLSYALAGYFTLETIAWLTWARNKPVYSSAVAGGPRPMVMTLEPRSAFGNICMSTMAASMAYMFVGMQLMMTPMPRQSQLLAQQQQAAPPRGEQAPGRYEPEPLPATQAPNAVASEPARPPAATAPPAVANTYTVVAGDTLRGIAARLYGSAREWHSIEKANPGLDPRRLHIGQAIKLPSAVSPRYEGRD
jgi:LysM repeat protein